MAVLEILSASYLPVKDEILVHAIVEDAVCTRPPTMYDPPEFGPAKCFDSICTMQIDENGDIDFTDLSGSQLERLITDNQDSITFNWRLCND